MATPSASASVHDQLLAKLETFLVTSDFKDIQMDHNERWPCPRLLRYKGQGENEGFRPDAVATHQGKRYLIEVEDELTYANAHTQDQLKMFAAHAKQFGGSVVLVVPSNVTDAATAHLSKLGLTEVTVWGT